MRRFLFLVLGMGMLLPTAVNAGDSKYYLVFDVQAGLHTVPMKSKAGCEKALEKVLNMDNWQFQNSSYKPRGGKAMCLKSE
tara:strand:- start:483 stop:725 length:243 start_codon:yes stop_codon:yes gene_type:complete